MVLLIGLKHASLSPAVYIQQVPGAVSCVFDPYKCNAHMHNSDLLLPTLKPRYSCVLIRYLTTYVIIALLKKGAIMDLGCLSFRHSVRHNFVSTQYLENKLIEFNHFLSMS